MLGEILPRPLNDWDLQVFNTVVPPSHYLRRVSELIDFDRFRDRMSDAYSPDQGRPADDPVVYLKLEFLQYHDNLSDRKVIERGQTDLAYRFFLGMPLSYALPHPSSLSYFRARLGPEKHREIFDELVAQAREQGLVKDRLRLKDATHVIANVAIPSTLQLVARVREKLLAAAEPYDAERVAGERIRVEMIHAGDEGLAQDQRLVLRVDHLRDILDWAEVLPAPDEDAAAWRKLGEACRMARKVLGDRATKDGRDRTVSVADPDARFGKHGQPFCGFKVDIVMDADSQIITSMDVLPANGDEAANATPLIQHEEEVHGNDVAALSIDSIGFDGRCLSEWVDPEGLNLEVFVPPKQEARTDCFTAKDFKLADDGESVVCPAGQTSCSRNRNEKDTGWMYRFRRATCASCPLLSQCMKQLPKSKGRGRTVTKNDYQAHYDAARAKAQTAEYREVRREHPKVERKIWEVVDRHGGRRARSRGQPQVLVQELLSGFTTNVKRIVNLMLVRKPLFA